MPAHNTVSPQFHVSKSNKPKKNKYPHQKQSTPDKEAAEKRRKRRYRRYLIGGFLISATIIGIILAGLLPALIVNATRSSNSNSTTNGNNAGGSSGGNNNGANNTTVAPGQSSSGSTTNSASTTVQGGTTTGGTTIQGGTTTGGTAISTSTSAYGFTAGGAVVAGTSAYYGYEQVTVSCTVDLTDIIIYITVQKTVNATYRGAFSTFWGGTVNQTYTDTGSEIIYVWTIVSGQTIQASGSPYRAQAQFNLFGINQTTSADTYNVTATTVTGLTNTISGTF